MFFSKKRNIKCYGYITNNLYNLKYFKNNHKECLEYLLGVKSICVKSPDFFSSFFDYIENMYISVEKELNTYSLDVYHHFDPNDEKNIILASTYLQPKIYDEDKYFVLNPKKSRFSIEKNVEDDLKKFIEKKGKKIAYISTGSFIRIDCNFYITFIEDLLKADFKVIVATRDCYDEVEEYIRKRNLKNAVYNSRFISQKYVLKNASIFISAGGYNSILESIYYKVPMLIIPFSAEQRYVRKIIEETKLGNSSFEINDQYSSIFTSGFSSLSLSLLNREYKDNLKLASDILKKNNYEANRKGLLNWLNSD